MIRDYQYCSLLLCLSFSFLVVAAILPLLTDIADYSGKRLFFMKVFVYIGSFSCMGLFFFKGANIEYGITLSILASISFAGSLVFYNSYLPQIASLDKIDSVSAKGFAYGYVGSVILLVINLIMIQKYCHTTKKAGNFLILRKTQ